MALDPDIQQHFDYKYVEGELHIYIRKEFVEELGWTDQDLEMSFGGIRKMNKWGDDVNLSIHKIKDNNYKHPWDEHCEKNHDPRTERTE
tara:strand:- start:116 stop:382 length:267 start_codon:yes stop_codon:yes gene_type:complete